MSVSLYRKYRPQNFASVVGQKSAIDVLTNSILKSRVGHAYLFSGSRGCGKTSVARIFAKALNCLNPQGYEPCGECQNCKAVTSGESLDVIEIDGASNNGVENIRGLKENVNLAPFSSKYKIYIIDEVHMLSTGAFNALLKTLEEPPEHVIFIMATTEPHKVPVTIRSRCQHIPFHSISPEDIFTRLSQVCELEKINAEPEALREISRLADGALRDALSLLEQIISAGDITLANVEAIFGAGSRPAFERWIKALRENPAEAYSSLKNMFDAGASGVRVFEELFALVKNLWLVSKWQNIIDALNLSLAEKNFLLDEIKFWKPERLHAILHIILKLLTQARLGIKSDILLGMFMLYLAGEPPKLEAVQPVNQVKVLEVMKQEIKPEVKPEIKTLTPDLELKERILNVVHDNNFVIYCGLFDADAYEQDGALLLEFTHEYCYNVMRVDRRAANLQAMLIKYYRRIILRFNNNEYICPNTVMKQPAEIQAVPKVQEAKQEIMPEVKPETPKQETRRATTSPFDSLVQELASLGMKPEKLFTRKTQQENNQNENYQQEQEGENE